MAIDASTLRSMLKAGCTAEQIVSVAEDAARADAEVAAAKREKDRIRKRVERESKKNSNNNDRVQGFQRTSRNPQDTVDASPLDKKAPTPPKNYSPLENPLSPPKGGSPSPSADDLDLTEAVAIFNAAAAQVGWAMVQVLTTRRRTALRLRLAECGGLEGWRAAMARARGSPFLCGENDRHWKADFDFFLQAKSFTKLMEGAYDRSSRPAQSSRGQHDLAAAFDRLADHAQRLEDAHPPPSGWGRQ